MEDEKDRKPLNNFFLASNEEPHSSILNPTILANNFELKSYLFANHTTKPIRWSPD